MAQPALLPYFRVFYFDFLANVRIIWGLDFRARLPPPNDARALVLPSLNLILERLEGADSSDTWSRRAAAAAYKAAAMLQLYYGELTLDKRRILSLYRLNVPRFPSKSAGETIIRAYLEAEYPDKPPKYGSIAYYVKPIRSAVRCIDD